MENGVNCHGKSWKSPGILLSDFCGNPVCSHTCLVQDLIIEVIYADVIRGKLDQKNQQLEVDYAIGRDIQTEAVTEIISVLQSW